MYQVNVYNVSTEGNTRIAKNFKAKEFACKDGNTIVIVSTMLADYLQKARDHFGKPLIINSGFRTVSHNKAVRGVSNSQHLYGVAADCYMNGVAPETLYNFFCEICPDSCGVGLYDWGVHFDVRPIKARWDSRTKK